MPKYAYAIALLSTSMLLACSNKQSSTTENEEVTYPIATITQKDTVLAVPHVAALQALKNIEIRSRADGMLAQIHIKEGQQVKKGQLLFSIHNGQLEIELAKAEARYNSAKADADVAKVETERVKLLIANNVVAKTELDLAKAKHKAALAQVNVALAERDAVTKNISYTKIQAPFDGIIDRIPLKEGSLVSSNSLLTTISDISTMQAYFNISEYAYFQMMQRTESDTILDIKLELPDNSKYPYAGRLSPAESEIDAETGSIAFKVLFDNPNKLLRHGASGKVLISSALEKAILIPQKAVFEIQDKYFVYVLTANQTVKMKSIKVKQRLGDLYLISDGLTTGDKIVVEGIQSLKDEQKISTKNS